MKRSVCTRRISDRMAKSAVSCTGAKLLCLASAARPTEAKNLCSWKPTDLGRAVMGRWLPLAGPPGTKAARQLLSSWGAKVMSLELISFAAAVKKTFESCAKSGALRRFGSADQAATVLQAAVNCMLVSSRSLEESSRQSSAKKSLF